MSTNSRWSFDPYNGPYGRGVLVPPVSTHGVWIEFFKR